jgi:hypothetical protein
MTEKNKFLGPLGKEIFETRPIGGRIPKESYNEWEDFKSKCGIAGLKPNPYGMLDMLTTYNKINKVIFPIANSYGFKPIEFKNKVIDIILQSLSEITDSKWDKESKEVKEAVYEKIKTAIQPNKQ